MAGRRANGEGSIFPYRTGYAAYVWVTQPDGTRSRKWAYGKTRQEVHDKWLKLHAAAKRGPVKASTLLLKDYLTDWLREVVRPPEYAPLTCSTYETLTRLYILPGLGNRRLDKLTVRDVRIWLNEVRETCQCWAQGKDARRPEAKQRCCARGKQHCCKKFASDRTVRDAWIVLCSALTNAVTEDLIPKNVAGVLHLSKPRRRQVRPWTADEARRFLESAKKDRDPLYAVHPRVAMRILRHAQIEVTMDVYTEVSDEQTLRALKRLGDQLDS
jgi:integrase